jgi:thiol-disulfide isomerase/thioredoxin
MSGRLPLVSAATALLLVLTGCGKATPAPTAGRPKPCRATSIISVGQRIPFDCEFRTMSGETLSLQDLKGKPTLLNFWASWCPNCVDEMPALQKAHEELGDEVRFLGANLLKVDGETESAAKAFAKRFAVTYDSIYDEGGLLYAHFSPRLFPPTTIWIDAQGVVKFRKFGPLDLDTIKADVRTHLGVG